MLFKCLHWIFILELLFGFSTSSPVNATFGSKLSALESDLKNTKNIVHEMLESVNKLSKESLVSKAELETIKSNIDRNGVKIESISQAQESGDGENLERRFQMVLQTIQDSKDSVSAVLEDAMMSVDAKIDVLKDEILQKLVNKVKRQEAGKFVSEEAFNKVVREIQELSKLPTSLNNSVSKTFKDMTADLDRMTISKEEFASFQLSVARDTCRSRFEEGEWVVVQRRGQHGNPQDYFSRGMADYVGGFGDPSAEFWLGLDKMLLLTKNGAELRIDLETYEGRKIYARYSSFRLEGEDYKIQVAGYEGNAGDPLRIDNGMAFSTKDSDKDQWVGDCSKTRGNGGWWFNGCGLANLNGINYGKNANRYDGIIWYFYAKDNRSFKSSQMRIRKSS